MPNFKSNCSPGIYQIFSFENSSYIFLLCMHKNHRLPLAESAMLLFHFKRQRSVLHVCYTEVEFLCCSLFSKFLLSREEDRVLLFVFACAENCYFIYTLNNSSYARRQDTKPFFSPNLTRPAFHRFPSTKVGFFSFSKQQPIKNYITKGVKETVLQS